MTLFPLFLMVLALVLFFLSAIGIPDQPRFRLVAAGLFCWLLAVLIAGIGIAGPAIHR